MGQKVIKIDEKLHKRLKGSGEPITATTETALGLFLDVRDLLLSQDSAGDNQLDITPDARVRAAVNLLFYLAAYANERGEISLTQNGQEIRVKIF